MHLRHHLAPLAFAIAAATSATAVAGSYGNTASDESHTPMASRTEQARAGIAPGTSTQASGTTARAPARFDTQATIVGRPVGTEPMLNQADAGANGANVPDAANTVNSTAFDEQETANGQAVGTETAPLRPLVHGTGRAHTADTYGTRDANDRANGRDVQRRPAFDTPSTANGYSVGDNRSYDASADGQWAQEGLFGLLDADGNGRLTRNEIVHDRALARDMGRIDRNHDGVLSYDEFSSYRS